MCPTGQGAVAYVDPNGVYTHVCEFCAVGEYACNPTDPNAACTVATTPANECKQCLSNEGAMGAETCALAGSSCAAGKIYNADSGCIKW